MNIYSSGSSFITLHCWWLVYYSRNANIFWLTHHWLIYSYTFIRASLSRLQSFFFSLSISSCHAEYFLINYSWMLHMFVDSPEYSLPLVLSTLWSSYLPLDFSPIPQCYHYTTTLPSSSQHTHVPETIEYGNAEYIMNKLLQIRWETDSYQDGNLCTPHTHRMFKTAVSTNESYKRTKTARKQAQNRRKRNIKK